MKVLAVLHAPARAPVPPPREKVMVEEHIARNRRDTALVLAFMFGLLWAVTFAIGLALGAPPVVTLVLGVVVAAVYIAISSAFSVESVLKATGARPVNPAVREEKLLDYRVEEIAIAAGIPKPRVFVQDSNDVNAFATGLTPENSVVCATTGALRLLSPEELEGVIAHEISHVVNRDVRVTTITIGVVGAIALLSEIAIRLLFHGRGRGRGGAAGPLLVLGIVFVILAPIFSRLAYLFLSRRREYLADASGANLTKNPEGLAGALEKILHDEPDDPKGSRTAAGLYFANPWTRQHLDNAFSTHPPLEERIRRLRGM